MTLLSMSSQSSVDIECPPGVPEIIGSNPIGDSDFFFAPCLCYIRFYFNLFAEAANSPSFIYHYLPHIKIGYKFVSNIHQMEKPAYNS